MINATCDHCGFANKEGGEARVMYLTTFTEVETKAFAVMVNPTLHPVVCSACAEHLAHIKGWKMPKLSHFPPGMGKPFGGYGPPPVYPDRDPYKGVGDFTPQIHAKKEKSTILLRGEIADLKLKVGQLEEQLDDAGTQRQVLRETIAKLKAEKGMVQMALDAQLAKPGFFSLHRKIKEQEENLALLERRLSEAQAYAESERVRANVLEQKVQAARKGLA